MAQQQCSFHQGSCRYPYRVTRSDIETEEHDSWLWSPPKGSKELEKALEYHFPDCGNYRDRLREAINLLDGVEPSSTGSMLDQPASSQTPQSGTNKTKKKMDKKGRRKLDRPGERDEVASNREKYVLDRKTICKKHEKSKKKVR
jgi:hypothetical protein